MNILNVFMNNLDVSLIIQGPVNYYLQIIDSYKGIKNVLWCTWEDESKESINAIKEAGIYVHLIKKPLNTGYWNINFQCKSTYEGILKSKELFNTQYYLKVRSDFKISNVSLLCDRFIAKKEMINFLGWANEEGGFFLDYLVFGDYKRMKNYWRFQDDKNNGRPCPEIFLMKRFFDNNHLPYEIKLQYSSKFPLLDGINFYWVSRGINIRDFSSSLEFNYTENKIKYYLKFKILNAVSKIYKIVKF